MIRFWTKINRIKGAPRWGSRDLVSGGVQAPTEITRSGDRVMRKKRSGLRISAFNDRSIQTKLTALFLFITLNIFAMDIFVCLKVNHSIYEINQVYSSNVDTNQLNDTLNEMQNNVYAYLSTRSSSALEAYYKSEEQYSSYVEELNQNVTDNEVLNLERDIHFMSETYIQKAEETIQEKRGGNIEKYKTLYEETAQLKQYISENINNLNNLHFKQNARQYTILLGELKRVEGISLCIMISSAAFSLVLIYMFTGNLIAPLIRLAESARKVAEGDFSVQIGIPSGKDEISSVTIAFNSMIVSIREYIHQIKLNMEKEKEMQERELLMETHLKDAQLKYLQAQINPHFLFNSLNAGVQLAEIEDAEKTCLFLEKMADFFRYNVKKMTEETTLGEEVEAVDNYIYIMNVRFAGDIHYGRIVDRTLYHIKVPSMILQPLVENALNYGVHDIEWEKKITLEVKRSKKWIILSIADNGVGMSKERIKEVLQGKQKEKSNPKDSTGIGIDNVKSRLELYYKMEHLLYIDSDGMNKGTRITIRIPLIPGGEAHVQDTISG